MSNISDRKENGTFLRMAVTKFSGHLVGGINEVKTRIQEELKSPLWGELRARPRKALYLLEPLPGRLRKSLLNIALDTQDRLGPPAQFGLLDWNDAVLTAEVANRQSGDSELGAAQIVEAGEKTLRLFWERYMLSGTDLFRIQGVKLSRFGEWKSPLKIRYGLDPEERERMRIGQGRQGNGDYEVSMMVLNNKDLLVAELLFAVQWQTSLSLSSENIFNKG